MGALPGPAAFMGEVTGDSGASQRGLPSWEQQRGDGVQHDLLQTRLANRGSLGLLEGLLTHIASSQRRVSINSSPLQSWRPRLRGVDYPLPGSALWQLAGPGFEFLYLPLPLVINKINTGVIDRDLR